MFHFFSAVSIVVCEHWMIASLCDVVLLVNAFGNTWCARFFSLFKLQLSLSIRYQTTAKLWTTLFLPHITSHPKHTKRQRHFFRPQTTFCDCFFFFLLETLTRNTQWNPVECMQILEFTEIPSHRMWTFSYAWNRIKKWKKKNLEKNTFSFTMFPLWMFNFFSFRCFQLWFSIQIRYDLRNSYDYLLLFDFSMLSSQLRWY